MIPLITCEKLPLVKMSASWFLVSMYLIWIFGVQINSIKQPVKCNSVSPGNMSHCWTSSFHYHLDNSLMSSNPYYKASRFAALNNLRELNQCLSPHRFCCETSDVCEHHSQVSPIDLKHEKHFQEQKQLDPIVPEQVTHPVSVQCSVR